MRIELATSVMGDPYGNVNSDGSDIRFTDIYGTTLQDYWVESWNNTGTSSIWVEVRESGTSMIYMYYGNNNATSASNGDNTFEFFDDFGGGSVDTDKWQLDLDSGASASIVDGALRLYASSSSDQWVGAIATGKVSFARPFALDIKVKNASQDNSCASMRPVIFLDDGSGNNLWGLEDASYAQHKKYRKIIGGVSTDISDVAYDWGASWHNLEAIMTNTTNQFYFDSILDASDTTHFAPNYGVMVLKAVKYYTDTVSDKYFDNVVVRKYVSPEPSVSVGPQTSQPDTDGDGWRDGDEVSGGTDPFDPESYPAPDMVIFLPEDGGNV